jgi:chromosome partitioning protein
LLRIEDRIHELRAPVIYQILDLALGTRFKQYDYVLLDCPPNLYSTTKAAIFSSDTCIVPYVPDYLSLSGFQVLAEQIVEMREKFAPYLPGRRKPNIGALIVSHYRQTGNVFRLAVNELELSMAALRQEGMLSEQAILLQPYIRHCVRVAESTSEHLPVILYAPGSIGAQDYADLTQRLVDLFESKK